LARWLTEPQEEMIAVKDYERSCYQINKTIQESFTDIRTNVSKAFVYQQLGKHKQLIENTFVQRSMDGLEFKQILTKILSETQVSRVEEVVNWVVQFVYGKSSSFERMQVRLLAEMLEIEDLRVALRDDLGGDLFMDFEF
jgi:hypothetical protein